MWNMDETAVNAENGKKKGLFVNLRRTMAILGPSLLRLRAEGM